MRIYNVLRGGAVMTAVVLGSSIPARGETPVMTEEWLGELPAHRALCMEGTSASTQEFSKVPNLFVKNLEGVPRFGNLFFDQASIDQTEKKVTWRICVPVEASVKAPAGLAARGFPASRAVFGLCPGATTADPCSQATMKMLSDRLSDAQKAALNQLLVRGAQVSIPPPPGTVDRLAVANDVVRTGLGKDLNSGDPASGATGLLVNDSTIHRAPLTDPRAKQTPSPTGSGIVIVVPIPDSLLEPVKAALTP
ncbi:MAG TPA: hypothetical protein VH988_05890 [Thermoanaerobaculia bacterium]|jgi:hypothetical protein|nr:hypothetical protein [Thermoanaerobaculia bacterium]